MEGTVEDQDPYEQILGKSWKILLIRGIFISLVGTVLLIKPTSGLAFTAVIFSLFIALDGITQLVVGFRMNTVNELWWGSVLKGTIEVILAAVIISHPKGFGELGASALLILLGIVFLVSGIIDYQFRKGKTGTFSSIILFLLGILLLAAPLFAANIILRLIGIAALSAGTARIYRAFQYKRFN
ncbi:HdeD family acid-resistance protein [Spirochaeta isovalerica]|uniref:Uncharacterized membrane protein HdeD (DUF308 family) n=1 Tax=Spirochaeta isovalerica TaxID=150 RepID=A0A841R0I9_9SPIO|nr:DUF308 domain-containing protein [Spirochaeta isovalerica]MBB6478454.1 uncharacterized membrane protein HdeD (DUF308 family) [Spirochaeta isovalerica]